MDYEVKFEQLKDILVEKLFTLISGKTSQGVMNDLGEEVLPKGKKYTIKMLNSCLLYTSPSPRDKRQSRMPSSA